MISTSAPQDCRGSRAGAYLMAEAPEEVKPGNVESLYDITLRWNAYTKPLLVDGRTGTILDGHHRYHVGLRIGLLRLPVIKVDYLNDEGIELDIWPGSDLEALTKQRW